MSDFPRTLKSRLATPAIFPEGLDSWGQSGKGQGRSFENIGRMWQEVYPVLDMKSAAGRELMMAINSARREKSIWRIQHPYLRTNYGVGGGTITVSGGSQTGSSIVLAGAPHSTALWLRAGDIIAIAGLGWVIDVAANVNSDSDGIQAVPISPPIFVGQSPSNGAAVTIDASQIYFNAMLVGADVPDIDAGGQMPAGLTLTWREQIS